MAKSLWFRLEQEFFSTPWLVCYVLNNANCNVLSGKV
jgi:hypothetical protein